MLLFYSCGGHFVQRSGTIEIILVDGLRIKHLCGIILNLARGLEDVAY